jgi:hypothetical protein
LESGEGYVKRATASSLNGWYRDKKRCPHRKWNLLWSSWILRTSSKILIQDTCIADFKIDEIWNW